MKRSRGFTLVEVMVALANQLSADPWFCIPHMADDDYVARFAAIARDNVDPGLKIHVEYSNEVWNSGFSQATYAREQGLAEGLRRLRAAFARHEFEVAADQQEKHEHDHRVVVDLAQPG